MATRTKRINITPDRSLFPKIGQTGYTAEVELVTNNFLPSQKVFATPARCPASAGQRCAFRFPTRSKQLLRSISTNAKARLRGLHLWRWGESNPRAITDGLGFYGA